MLVRDSYTDIIFNSTFNIFLVNMKQMCKTITWFEVPAFCKYITFHIIKTTSLHEGNFRTEKIGHSSAQFSYVPCCNFWCNGSSSKKHAPCNTFSRNHEPNPIYEISLSYLQKSEFITVQENINFQLVLFLTLECCYKIIFAHNTLCPSNVFLMQICKKNFQSWI